MQAGAFLGDSKVGVLDIEEPPAPGPGEVQVDVAYTGVCGSDLHMVQHNFFAPGDIPGHEFSGSVAALGPGVGRYTVGQGVAVRPFLSCGGCAMCESDRTIQCASALGIGSGHGIAARILSGGMAPRINVPVQTLHAVGDGVALEHAALVEPLAVALHAVRTSGIQKGDTVLVMGAGPIGVALIICARLEGAGKIVVTEHSQARAEDAARFGADEIVLAGDDGFEERVASATGGGAAIVFDAVGVPGTIEEAIRLVAPRGRVQIVGVCMEPDPVFPAGWLLKEPTLRVCFIYTEAEFDEMTQFVSRGDVPCQEMISRVEPMTNIAGVFSELSSRPRDIKVLLEPIR